MRTARCWIALAAALGLLASCGTAEVQGVVESQEDGTSLDVGVDTGSVAEDTGTTEPKDTGPEEQCLNKFDCLKLDLKGQTPCTVPDCVNKQCVFVPRDEGSKCDDPTQTGLEECLETRCDANAECKAMPRPEGAACQGNATGLDECQVTACNKDGKCEVTNKADKTLCGLGACKHCKEGQCTIKSADDLNDGNPCTLDSCDVNQGEQHKKITDITAVCDDGDPCTGDGNCLDGECKAKALDCDDGVSCTGDSCDGEKGCVHKIDDKACTNDDPCLQIACDLSEGCTTTKINVGAKCDDGDNECTNDDKCGDEGNCAGTPICGCKEDKDCLGDDGKHKNQCKPQICEIGGDGKGLCVPDLAAEVTCTEDGGPCAEVACDPKSGECASTAIKEGKDCDDGNKCTTKPICKEGKCLGEIDEKKCDDSNPCTLDACDPAAGCSVEPASGSCDDNDPCTEEDHCDKGGCTGDQKACDDGVTCTKDTCDPTSGKCVLTPDPKLCSDDNECTEDICDDEGKLGENKGCVNKPNDSAKCEDDNKCTITECKSGQCVVKEYDKTISGCACTSDKACDDDNPCTIDKCAAGDCKNDAAAMDSKACATGNVCHVDNSGVCKAGACTGGKAKDCSSVADKCHSGACNNKTGKCEKVQKPDKTACDADGSKCTVGDACAKGTCVKGPEKKCPDGDQCNDATCDAKTGNCGKKPKKAGTDCDDSNICTEKDTCDAAGKCKPGTAKDCKGSGDQCNNGLCDQADGCVAVSKGDKVSCNDGKFCTKTDICDVSTVDGKKVGKCVGSGEPACKANAEKCEVAFCDAKANKCAIKPAPANAPCSDGSKCTLNDKCDAGGKCKAGPAKTCTGDQCNDPICTASTGACGLKAKATGTGCNDGDQCTQKDTCSGGKCVGANPKSCGSDACNTGVCDAKSGNCGKKPKSDGTACSDGQACTAPDKCQAGACKGGLWTCGCQIDANCDDKNPCTTNTCAKGSDGKLSCKTTPKTGANCNDNNACTLTDQCQSNGSCKGTAKNCDDKNQCTADSCSNGSCINKVLFGASCDDGKKCTYNDKCNIAKQCIGTNKVCNDGNGCTNDSCNTSTGGCDYVANTNSCSDGNACTLNDKCSNKTCKAGASKNCSDGTKCTTDKCDTKSGKCSYASAYDNYTCEKGNSSRCWNSKCECIHWQATIGSTHSSYYEYLYDVERDGDNWVAVGMRRYYTGSKYYYYGFAAKRDRFGKNIWERVFSYGDLTQGRLFYSLARNTKANRWMAVGYTYHGTTYSTDGWAVEFDDNGYQKRNTIFRHSGYHKGKKADYFRDVVMDSSGEFYAAGYTYNAVLSARSNAWMVKFKVSGTSGLAWSWEKVKADNTYSSAYYGVGYSSSYNKAIGAGYTYTKANSQQGLIGLFTSTGGITYKDYGDTNSSQSFNKIVGYSSYWMAVGNYYTKDKSNQGWMLSGYASTGNKYQESHNGSTSSDSFTDISCSGSYCITMGRSYNTSSKKYQVWLRRHYYRYATSKYSETSFDVPSTYSWAAVGYRNTSEIAVVTGYNSNGLMMQTSESKYEPCK